MTPAVRSAFVVLLAAVLVAGLPGDARTQDDLAWRDALRHMALAQDVAFEGRLLVVSFHGEPTVGEVTIVRDEDGTVLSSPARRWVIGHRGGETVLGDIDEGRLLRVGAEQSRLFSLHRVARNYDVSIVGEEEVLERSATVLEFRPRSAGHVRERVHLDLESGIVLRRETYTEDGQPVRLATFTTIELDPQEPPRIGSDWVREEVRAISADVSKRGMRILRDVGWFVPEQLPGGFTLVDAFAVGEGDGSSLHLLFSDGLYALSVYEQDGRLDVGAAIRQGAERVSLGGKAVLRWPAGEPATYLWSGEGMTFTAVTDAPPDAAAVALAHFPADRSLSIVDRLRRGVSRVFDALSSDSDRSDR